MNSWKYWDNDCLILVDDDGYRCIKYSLDRVLEIRKARAKMGYNDYTPVNEVDHPFVGRKYVRISNGKVYNIEKVKRDWYFGWYYTALLENNGSHFCPMIENINCYIPEIEDGIKMFNKEYRLE